VTTTPEPWNFTAAQRLQFREAHAEAKRREAEPAHPAPWPPPFSNYTGWAVADPATECPDCGAPFEGFSGDLDELLAAIDEHQKVCGGTPS
jgi:hypothetical protein